MLDQNFLNCCTLKAIIDFTLKFVLVPWFAPKLYHFVIESKMSIKFFPCVNHHFRFCFEICSLGYFTKWLVIDLETIQILIRIVCHFCINRNSFNVALKTQRPKRRVINLLFSNNFAVFTYLQLCIVSVCIMSDINTCLMTAFYEYGKSRPFVLLLHMHHIVISF